MPLIGHDLPPYHTSLDEPEVRAHVFARRSVTGHQLWYWQLTKDGERSSSTLHGPYVDLPDAHDHAEEFVGAYQ
jgi:hypothetical protein